MSRSADVSERLRGLVDAACTSEIGQAELQELSALLRRDERARRFYAAYCRMHAELYFAIRAERAAQTARQSAAEEDSGFTVQGSECGVGAAVELPHELEVPEAASLIPPIIIIDTSPTIHYPLFTIHSSLGGWLFSYGVATLLMGVAILGAWTYKVSLEAEIARDQAQPAPQGAEPKPAYVGRITGTADCHWAGPEAPSFAVPLARKYELASGLMEITYTSGAKVILQGPCATKSIPPPAASSPWAS